MRASALAAIPLLMLPGLAGAVGAGNFTLLGPDGGAFGISADGQIAVGIGNDAQALRWDSGPESTGLGYLPGGSASTATGASTDGAVVVGWGTFPTPGAGDGFSNQAFRWTASGGMTGLGILPGGYNSSAEDVSADGSVVVGSAQTDCDYQAFRWTSDGGMVALDSMGCSPSLAYGVSADGQKVVGARYVGDSPEAFRWTAEGGMAGLGFLTGADPDNYAGGDYSVAHDVSADGSVVVGISSSVSGREAFRWTAEGGMAGLGFLPGNYYSNAEAVSADGSVVVGWALGSSTPGGSYLSDQKAVIWSEAGGLRPLIDELLTCAASGLAGWDLVSAQGISADGRWVVGQAVNALGQGQAFLARLADCTPDSFSFPDETGAAVASPITSAPVTITGIDAPAPVAVTTGGAYSVDCTGTFVTTPGTIDAGHTVCVRHASAATNSTSADTTLTIGGVQATFTSTTVAASGGDGGGGGGGGGGGALDGLSLLALGLLGWRRRKVASTFVAD